MKESEKIKISEECQRILLKYPEKIPIYLEKYKENSYNFYKIYKSEKIDEVSNISNKKFLVNYDTTVGEFLYLLRKRIKMKPDKAIFLFINDKLCATHEPFGQIYEREKNFLNFLHVIYSFESTFG
jgi:GABA(A) receptor-associated protein